MREYGRVHSAFWSSADVQALSDDAKLLALYLLSCSHGTIAGVCRLPDGYVSEDLKWGSGRVSKGFDELSAKGFADRCQTTKWVWIRKFLQWNAPENPNQWKAIWKVVGQIPSQCRWRTDFLELLSKLTGREMPPEANPSETVSEPFRNLNSISTATASQQEEDTSASTTPARKRGGEPDWAQEFKLVYPARSGDQGWSKAWKAANARGIEGHTSAEFIAGARRYAEFCRVTGKAGTEYVKQACTFLGPDKPFLLPWHPPNKPETSMERIIRLNSTDNSRVIDHEPEPPRALTG